MTEVVQVLEEFSLSFWWRSLIGIEKRNGGWVNGLVLGLTAGVERLIEAEPESLLGAGKPTTDTAGV